ncbi:hypothetical protein DPM19_26290 [Actinomadura craniellae]|uniref:DUF2029 domain-containing protein n=1 Tax=Actinomadura craniellae TaxID=2231787 RepID=A0A365GZI7_9ACTN|nr:glycosyltransferase family 87 protein [Actinomadura craniellae]RAY12231.1 hypothetical protein DPM19_26290 [Actinomadura craniellae]
MDHPILTTFLLITGFALALIAQWRGWRPSLRMALGVGIGLRLVLLIIAAGSDWQPVDFVQSFRPAGEAILARQDPILTTDGAWRFLPMIPYVYALPLGLGIPWEISGRLVTVVADIVLIVLVGKLAAGGGTDDKAAGREALARFQYACNPLALMVAVIHAQLEPVSLVFLVGAYLAARSGRGWYAGVLFGLALSAKSWPIILLPVLLAMLPTWRLRAQAFVMAGAVPVLFLLSLPLGAGTPLSKLREISQVLGWVRPIVGEWGWTAMMTGGEWALVPAFSKYGQMVLYATLLVVMIAWWRSDKVDTTTAMLLAFMLVTPRLGAQYLLWFVPFLIARPTRFGQAALASAALWAGLGYIYLTQYVDYDWWWRHRWWAQASLLVIPVLGAAIPWERRRRLRRSAEKEEPPVEAPGEPPVGALR